MKKFFVFIIALMMILMSIPVSAHDECIGESNTDNTPSEIYAIESSCNHSFYCTGNTTTKHQLTCTICDYSDFFDHDPREHCDIDRCATCGFIYGRLTHTYSWLNTNSNDGSETHAMTCRRYCSPYGYCNYVRATENCIIRANGVSTYTTAVNGYHKHYQGCSLCRGDVYIESVRCRLTMGQTSCEYCG